MKVFLLFLIAYGWAADPNVKITEVVCPESFSALLSCAWDMLLTTSGSYMPNTGTLLIMIALFVLVVVKSLNKKKKSKSKHRSSSYDNRR